MIHSVWTEITAYKSECFTLYLLLSFICFNSKHPFRELCSIFTIIHFINPPGKQSNFFLNLALKHKKRKSIHWNHIVRCLIFDISEEILCSLCVFNNSPSQKLFDRCFRCSSRRKIPTYSQPNIYTGELRQA